MGRRGLGVLVFVLAGCAAGAGQAEPVRFVGDSQIDYARAEIEAAEPGAVVVAKVGAGVRDDYYAELEGDAPTIVNLGLNDTARAGEPYAAAVDDFMARLPGPVWWTNLPCELVLEEQVAGCAAVNAELERAARRWPNLTVLDWSAVATPEYIGPDGIHYSPEGRAAWVAFALEGAGASG